VLDIKLPQELKKIQTWVKSYLKLRITEVVFTEIQMRMELTSRLQESIFLDANNVIKKQQIFPTK